MDAAERLFAERGIDAVSLRTINAEAGYSVAALHYHFGTRDGLVRLSFDRSPYLARTIEDSFALFRPLLRRALPAVDERTLTRRWRFAADLAQQALANALEGHLGSPPGVTPRRAQFERFIGDLIAFIGGGLNAAAHEETHPQAPARSGASSRSAAL